MLFLEKKMKVYKFLYYDKILKNNFLIMFFLLMFGWLIILIFMVKVEVYM